MDKRLVIAVSIAKSGTHLTRKLLELLGYRVDGPILHAQSLEEYLLEAQELAHKTCLLIHSLPADIGWFGPELVERWHRTGSPPIIFNYRDPRDVLCSRIRFLIGETRHGKFEEHTENLLFSRILKSIQSKEERIRFMILQTEHYGISSFRRCSWMLRHPQVCCVRYEDLVGLRGGGDSTRQLQAIECIVAHLGVQVDVERVARQIYDENSPTFSQGKAGAWRREFSRENARLFRRAYWEILDAYGYNLD